MGVRIDEARRDDQPRGVDRTRRGGIDRADSVMRPSSIAKSARRGGAPVPSTIVPPLMIKSCIAATTFR